MSGQAVSVVVEHTPCVVMRQDVFERVQNVLGGEMTDDELRATISQGPGYAQDTVVLREAMERLQVGADLKDQQRLLTAWHNLFRKGTLSWGYDIDNPNAPFFHLTAG